MKIVGLVGPKRSGKDTAAAALVEQREFVRIGFADQVKELALRINPIIGRDHGAYWRQARLAEWVGKVGGEAAKNVPEVRRFLQELGTGVRDVVGERSWVTAWSNTAAPAAACWPVVVPDVRFLNEADYLRQQNAQVLLIRITRPGLDLSDTHVSETEQTGIQCDAELINNGTPEDLHAKVLALYDEWVSPRTRCTGNCYALTSLGPPEQCAFDAGHEGECEP